MTANYVALGAEQDFDADRELNRAKTPWKSNSALFGNPTSKTNVLGTGALIHDELIAKWRIYCFYRFCFCVIIILFSLACVSKGEAFRDYEKDNSDYICDSASWSVSEINIFGDLCVVSYVQYIRKIAFYHRNSVLFKICI